MQGKNKTHTCDWCEYTDKVSAPPAEYWIELLKKSKTGLLQSGIRWFACKKHKIHLENFKSVHRKFREVSQIKVINELTSLTDSEK